MLVRVATLDGQSPHVPFQHPCFKMLLLFRCGEADRWGAQPPLKGGLFCSDPKKMGTPHGESPESVRRLYCGKERAGLGLAGVDNFRGLWGRAAPGCLLPGPGVIGAGG